MVLEEELNIYAAKLNDLMESEGKFVLIHGDTVVGIYEDHEIAMKQGRSQFGSTPFLVKQIEKVDDGCGCRGANCMR